MLDPTSSRGAKGLYIFTPVWGEPYLTWFKKGLLRSFSWPKNKKIVDESKWIFASNADYPFPGEVIRVPGNQTGRDLVQAPLLEVIRRCLRDSEPLLIACSDFIFSDGSLEVFQNLGSAPELCVAQVHVRVNTSILDDLELSSGPELVTRAWRHLHRSWSEADCTKKESNCYSGGVSWRKIGGNIYVQHRLPNAFYVNFVKEDYDFFLNGRFDYWDHKWPSEWKSRQRLIGSSDGCFVAEVTDPGTHGPSLGETNLLIPDAFHKSCPHNEVNRQFVTVLRPG